MGLRDSAYEGQNETHSKSLLLLMELLREADKGRPHSRKSYYRSSSVCLEGLEFHDYDRKWKCKYEKYYSIYLGSMFSRHKSNFTSQTWVVFPGDSWALGILSHGIEDSLYVT